MAIEIRELVVRATVTKELNKKVGSAGLSHDEARRIKQEVLEECREWVKDYLKELKSR